MRTFTPITTESAIGTETGTASNVGSSLLVRLVNTHTAVVLVTLEESDGTDIGTFTLASGESAIIQKKATDKIFGGHVGVLICGVRLSGMHL